MELEGQDHLCEKGRATIVGLKRSKEKALIRLFRWGWRKEKDVTVRQFPLMVRFDNVSMVFRTPVDGHLFFHRKERMMNCFRSFLAIHPVHKFHGTPKEEFKHIHLFRFLPVSFIGGLSGSTRFLQPSVRTVLRRGEGRRLSTLPNKTFQVPMFRGDTRKRVPPRVHQTKGTNLGIPHHAHGVFPHLLPLNVCFRGGLP